MTTEEIKTDEISEIQKSDTSIVSLLAELVRKQDSRMDSFEKEFTEVKSLIKEQNKNPVDTGVEAENKPKTEDAKDVGDKVTVGNEIAPKPSESQASIISPAVDSSGTDKSGLKMENKSDDEEKDEKKDEVEKMDDDDEEKDEKKEVEKSGEYEIVKTVRPILKSHPVDSQTTVPTGYQILKAIVSGWGGKTSSAEESLTIAYNKLEAGEFGNGFPTGGVY
jgi:hypothetical protein